MLYCIPKKGWPVVQYTSVEELNAFLVFHGGKPARIEIDGIAWTTSIVKDEERTIFIKPHFWLRAMGRGQFSACSDLIFGETYNVYDDADLQC
ncbi:hypothetical protein GCM10028808_73000 [Spirosoma migulaei]